MTRDALDELEETLGYKFRDRTLLTHALTHSSRKSELLYSNERLEFLGDAILGAAISEFLYRMFPDHAEGALTRIKSVVVSRASLARAARDLGLERHLIVAKGVALPRKGRADEEETPRSLPVSLISNALEAIIAAVYLDGGWDAARPFVYQHVKTQIERVSHVELVHNFKSALQEYAQRELAATPIYRVASESGPDHGKSFEVVTVIAGKAYGAGHGSTKKAAEQMAAELTLVMLHAEEEEAANAPEAEAGEAASVAAPDED